MIRDDPAMLDEGDEFCLAAYGLSQSWYPIIIHDDRDRCFRPTPQSGPYTMLETGKGRGGLQDSPLREYPQDAGEGSERRMRGRAKRGRTVYGP
jgi:hypothetical protein